MIGNWVIYVLIALYCREYNIIVKYLRLTSTLLFIAVLCIFITAPTKYMQSFFDGLTIWAYNVLPAIFPFMVLTTINLKLQKKSKHSLTKLVFGISCDSVFFTSILCGYPVGAKAIADSNADCHTATLMSSFCSSAGPIFMFATVGSKLLQNTIATVILIVTHFLSVVINGLIYRAYKSQVKIIEDNTTEQSVNLGDIITNSALSVISVGGLIALFYMLTDILKSLLPYSLQNNLAIVFCLGLLEMTNGIFGVCRITDVATATVLCSTLISLGGLCVFAQCYAFLQKKEVRLFSLIKMKVTQAALSTIISFILVKICM